MTCPEGVDPLRFSHVRTKPSGLSLLSLCTPVELRVGFFYCCSSVCADIHCPGSEWLWWDVHDLHITHGK